MYSRELTTEQQKEHKQGQDEAQELTEREQRKQ